MLRGRGGDIWGNDLRLAASHFPKYRPFLKKNALSFQSFSSGNYFVLIIAQSDRDDNIIAGNITNMPHLWRWYLRVIFISIDMACRWHLRDISCLRHLTPMGFSRRGGGGPPPQNKIKIFVFWIFWWGGGPPPPRRENPMGVKCRRHEISLKCHRHAISIAM
jgi:hypothetical protein